MKPPSEINLHIDRVVIDEAVHRAGPDAIRAAVAAQLPALLAERGAGIFDPAVLGHLAADRVSSVKPS